MYAGRNSTGFPRMGLPNWKHLVGDVMQKQRSSYQNPEAQWHSAPEDWPDSKLPVRSQMLLKHLG